MTVRFVLVLLLGRRSGGGGYMVVTTYVDFNLQRSHLLWWQHK